MARLLNDEFLSRRSGPFQDERIIAMEVKQMETNVTLRGDVATKSASFLNKVAMNVIKHSDHDGQMVTQSLEAVHIGHNRLRRYIARQRTRPVGGYYPLRDVPYRHEHHHVDSVETGQ